MIRPNVKERFVERRFDSWSDRTFPERDFSFPHRQVLQHQDPRLHPHLHRRHHLNCRMLPHHPHLQFGKFKYFCKNWFRFLPFLLPVTLSADTLWSSTDFARCSSLIFSGQVSISKAYLWVLRKARPFTKIYIKCGSFLEQSPQARKFDSGNHL